MALQSIATSGIASNITSGIFTAYQFYGYAQFAMSVAQAIDGVEPPWPTLLMVMLIGGRRDKRLT